MRALVLHLLAPAAALLPDQRVFAAACRRKVVALAQQLAALNTTLCGGGGSKEGGGATRAGRLIGTVPVRAQLDAAWVMMGAFFELAADLQLERNDLMRVAQAGSLLFDAGQRVLAIELSSAWSLQAGAQEFFRLEGAAERQAAAAIRLGGYFVLSQQLDEQLAAALAAMVAPPSLVVVWLGSLCEALQLVATSGKEKGECGQLLSSVVRTAQAAVPLHL